MKSKLNIKSILIITIIGIFSLVFFNKSFAAVTGKVNVDVANVRQTTDSKSKIVEQASNGESVQIIEKTGDWYKVKYNKVEGYIRKDLITLDENTAETTSLNNTTNTINTETKNEESSNANIVEENKQEEKTTTIETASKENTEATQNSETQSTGVATEKNIETNTVEGMYTTKDSVKLKIMPLVNGNVIKEINKDTTINVLEVCNNWALIECGTDRGWVLFSKIEKVTEQNASAKTEELEQEEKVEEVNDEAKQEEKQEEKTDEANKVEEKTTEVAVKETKMYVNSEVINLRKEASTTSDSLAKLNKATEVTVIAKDGDWSKVKVNGKEGYIKSSLLSEKKPEVTTSRSLEQERQPVVNQTQETATTATQTVEQTTTATSTSSSLGAQVCSYAKQYLGCKYVYGGTTPNGFDCSGFTQYVFKHFGITLNRTAEAQASNGTYVAKSDLKAGDLVIFSSHAGIYLGNGTFIHAANPSKGVIITSMSDSYYVRNYITARRIVN